jgi:PAS domain S-box-containing protein
MPPGVDPLIFQAGIVGPLMLALVVQTAARRHQGHLQRYLFWLLLLAFTWLIGMVVQAKGGPEHSLLAAVLLLPTACFMAPLFCLMMLVYARIDVFEQSLGARWAVLAPFWAFLAGFVTNDWHGLMADPGETVRQLDAADAGPLYWAFQIWSNGAAAVGLGVCMRISWSGPTRAERRRAALLWLAALIPAAMHALFVYRVLPLDFPLTPAAFGVTSLLVVAAIQRYRLLEVPSVARRDVIEASADAVLIANLEESVVDLNPAACELLGAPRQALCGEPLAAVLARLGPGEPAPTFAGTLEALRAGTPPPPLELETGNGRILEISAGSPRDPAGLRAGHFVVLRDRTKERRAERLLHQSQKLESIGILAAGVAHEVNNPLSYVRANLAQLRQLASALEEARAELPKEVARASDDVQELLDESLTGLERMREIVQGLLRFSRPPTRRSESCEVNPLVEEAARFARLDGGARVALELDLAEGLPRVEASPEQLVQVFLNLFLNAVNALALRPDAKITASTGAAAEGIEIRIADNGPGVPEAIRSRIFDPFFTTSPPNEGTGLGLTIALDIVSEHGGSLELENPAGGGACFLVRLPRRAGA